MLMALGPNGRTLASRGAAPALGYVGPDVLGLFVRLWWSTILRKSIKVSDRGLGAMA